MKTILDSFIKEAIKTESVNFAEIVNRLTDIRTIRLLHAAMGLSTEANEFLDALKKFIFYGKELDVINLKEELGDSNWYQAIAMDELGTNYEEVLSKVIKKLRARYKLDNGEKGFTENAAVSRDLNKEREVLELVEIDLVEALEATGLNPIVIDENTIFNHINSTEEDDEDENSNV